MSDNNDRRYVVIDRHFFVLLLGITAFLYMAFKALNFALNVLGIAFDRMTRELQKFREVLADPVIFRFVVLIFVTVGVTAICITYLVRKYQLLNWFKNLFTHENDIDW